ncbi:serine hydrolase domain-containing protein [Rubrivirga sp. S365]|uniref:Serine hydrolase domain-containing protein n=1 Tax=Rubrivirga litoralis TaxID=3075598 RepID=A0ABU3BQX0_9BACT|nr:MULTISPECIES: serine hydrolase domain-containing protein [unclassified Rubrivirga]MDT0631684.1 serine hydrolase domain-containing protein [Rubrivirga sp. F394]MDT7855573.1 serine hydrolase domain-containing protein [Rubrivirga sp. S365]
MRRLTLFLLVLLAHPALAQPAGGAAGGAVPLDSLDALVEAFAAEADLPSVVVAVVRDGRRQVATAGAVGGAAPTARTPYEVGSVTKVVTALVLAEMAQRGEVALATPVGDLLPDSVRVPAGGAAPVTLADLATHTSGLPRLPPTLLLTADPGDPYAAYGTGDLYAFLDLYELPRAPGAAYEYSNLGGGLLGLALTRRAGGADLEAESGGAAYGALARERVLGPLGMDETVVAVPEARGLAPAVGPSGEPVPHWTWTDATVGAGGLRSTAADLLTLAEATIAPPPDLPAPLAAALVEAARPLRPVQGAMRIGLGWHVLPVGRPGDGVVWHDGGVGGGSSFVGLDREAGVGVVVLANKGGAGQTVTAFGFGLLRRLLGAAGDE